MKKIVTYGSLVLALVIFTSTFVGAETINTNLDSAVNMALENNLELKEAEISLEKEKLEYEKSIANNLTTQSDYNKIRAEYTLKNAEISYKNTYDSLIKNVVQQYNNLMLSKFNLQILEKRQKLENKLLEESQAKYEIGDIGNVSLLEQKNSYQDASYKFRSAQDNYEQSLREFKTTLGLDIENKLELSKFKEPKVWEISKEEVIKTTLNNSLNLKLKEKNLELAKLDKKRTEISSAKIDKKIAEKTVEKAEISRKRTKRELENSSVLAFYDYQQSIEEMRLKKSNFEKTKKDYRLKKEQYNEGLLTESELINYEISRMQAEYDYLSAVANYYNKKIALRQQMNIELEVVNSDN